MCDKDAQSSIILRYFERYGIAEPLPRAVVTKAAPLGAALLYDKSVYWPPEELL